MKTALALPYHKNNTINIHLKYELFTSKDIFNDESEVEKYAYLYELNCTRTFIICFV